jgi:hypothetical protein
MVTGVCRHEIQKSLCVAHVTPEHATGYLAAFAVSASLGQGGDADVGPLASGGFAAGAGHRAAGGPHLCRAERWEGNIAGAAPGGFRGAGN